VVLPKDALASVNNMLLQFAGRGHFALRPERRCEVVSCGERVGVVLPKDALASVNNMLLQFAGRRELTLRP